MSLLHSLTDRPEQKRDFFVLIDIDQHTLVVILGPSCFDLIIICVMTTIYLLIVASGAMVTSAYEGNIR